MKIQLVCLRQDAYSAMIQLHHRAQPQLHTLVDDPESADIILFVGDWSPQENGVLDNPLPKRYPEKTFVYFDSDGFIPLLPGVYTNAEKRRFVNLRRTESQMFVDALNPNVRPMQAEKRYLFSFAGGSTSILRKKLFKIKFARPDVFIENTSTYWHWDASQPGRDQRQKKYAETIASSHFGLCPRGGSAGGLRLYEVMQMGVAPVILSDKLLLPEGPSWENFAIRVPERKIKQLDTILSRYVQESAERGRLARQAYEEWFAPPVVFNNVIEACVRIRSKRRVQERWIRPFWGYMLWRQRFLSHLRGFSKNLILKIYQLTGRRFAYDMNRP